MDNRNGIFPIHRGGRFALVTASAGMRTERIACRFGLATLDDLDAVTTTAARRLRVSCWAVSPDPMTWGFRSWCPTVTCGSSNRSAPDPVARHVAGWGAEFGRELNATDDRDAFRTRSARNDATPDRRRQATGTVPGRRRQKPVRIARRMRRAGRRVPRRARLAYRDVASATNKRSR
jgi:hypothetical protein